MNNPYRRARSGEDKVEWTRKGTKNHFGRSNLEQIKHVFINSITIPWTLQSTKVVFELQDVIMWLIWESWHLT